MTSILESFNDPHARHAMMVHLPIAGSLLGLGLLLLLAAFRFKSLGLRVAVAMVYAAITVGAFVAGQSGSDAEERVERSVPALNAAEEAALDTHEEAGESAWVWLLVPAVCSLGLFVPKPRVRVLAGVLTLAAGMAGAGWIGWTGHLGGELVYTYGLGVPARGQAAAGPNVSSPSTPAKGERDEHDDDDHE